MLRTTQNLSEMPARRGRCSPIRRPGVRDAMGRKGPRIFSAALGLIAGPVVLISAFAVAPQVAAIEGAGPLASLRRARSLIGRRWPVALLVLVVLGTLAWLGSALLTGVFEAAVGGRPGAVSLLAGAAAAALSAVVFGPLPQVGLTLLYDRLRTREGA